MSSRRYLAHNHRPPQDLDTIKHDILDALVANTRLVQRHAPDIPRTGGLVYVGAAGIALSNYKLAELGLSEPSSSHLISNADAYLAAASSSRHHAFSPGRCSFIETYVGVSTLVLHRALQSSTAQTTSTSQGTKSAFADRWRGAAGVLQEVIQMVENDLKKPSPTDDDGDCEVLYGRAGLLYALLFLRSSLISKVDPSSTIASTITDLVSEPNLTILVESIILRGKTGAAFYSTESSRTNAPALMWSWHRKRYLGAAHGVAGILHVLLLCPFNIIAPHIPSILHTVEWLVDLQDSTGNWPTTGGLRDEPNDLVHWCHGAPGILILLSTVLRRLPLDSPEPLPLTLRDKINISLSRGASLVYSKGFLRKGVGLCHGVAGSIFALLAVADTRPENLDYLKQAIHLAHLATDYLPLTKRKRMSTPDRPWSLYEGTAGMCCAWGEILKRMESAKKPGIGCGMVAFDDLLSLD